MEPGGGGRDGARVLGKYGLLSTDVRVPHFTLANIGGQRDSADLGQDLSRGAISIRPRRPGAAWRLAKQVQAQHCATNGIQKRNYIAWLQLSSGLPQNQPGALLVGPKEKSAPFASGGRPPPN